MRTLRGKDGGKNTGGDRVAKKIITENAEEFDLALQTLIAGAKDNERVYATVDARNWNKAIRSFKQRQLDADYAGDSNRLGFYRDIKNRVVSCLQQPTARASSLFLFDCDSPFEWGLLHRELLTCVGLGAILDTYETKNGGHIITQPFEYPKLLDPRFHEMLKKNAMMLWAY